METFIEKDGQVQFQYTIESYDDHHITFLVYEVNSWSMNPETNEFDVVSDTDLYLRAYMKWDGCYHFWFGDNDGYLHLCGNDYIEKHIQVMNRCLEFAKTKIKKYDASVAE